MTPKEKAKELVEAFKPYAYYSETESSQKKEIYVTASAKQCAMIAVNELIDEASDNFVRANRRPLSNTEYWLQVKKEIEAL